jgi:hypothetical protein
MTLRHTGEWRYSSIVSGQLHAQAALPSVPSEYEAGWAPEPVRTLRSREKSLVPAMNRTPTIQSVTRRYTD